LSDAVAPGYRRPREAPDCVVASALRLRQNKRIADTWDLRRPRLAGVTLASLVVLACDVFEPPLPQLAPGTGGSSNEKPPDTPFWMVEDERGCRRARAPSVDDRPEQSDSAQDLPPIVLAISKTRHGVNEDRRELPADPEAWRIIGFDLDGTCTNSSTCEVEGTRVNEPSCSNSISTPFDGDACRDNTIGRIFGVGQSSPIIGGMFGMTEADWNCELHRGGFSTLIRISRYNGKPDDADVRVDLYTSTGLQVLPGWKCRQSIEEPLTERWYDYADWLSNSHWKVSARSVDLAALPPEGGLPDAKVADPAAYVRDGFLVAHLPDGSEFQWNGENTPVPGFRDVLRSPVLVAPLARDPDSLGWFIKNGTLSGAVTAADLLTGYREIGVCENMCNTFPTIENYLASNLDVLASFAGAPPSDAPCDALSIAIDFDARAATATADDIVDTRPPELCPAPRHSAAGRPGCICQPDGTTCVSPDGGM
jgi:hypothetical protein